MRLCLLLRLWYLQASSSWRTVLLRSAMAVSLRKISYPKRRCRDYGHIQWLVVCAVSERGSCWTVTMLGLALFGLTTSVSWKLALKQQSARSKKHYPLSRRTIAIFSVY
ncbi:hypothetical protein BJY04DRAFT_202550 [Aspergillus karnatakaensis]|uniref:uncharacterized protein n=1 Tax=Aspergillus karnatakaensis TaxID=1810916 RepID=UPI003CCD9BD7